MLCPVQCGNSNRSDILAIEASLLQSLGSAMTNEQLSNIEIYCCAISRAIYVIWAMEINFSNQFYPLSIDTTLDRWCNIFNIQPLPTDNLETIRNKIASKFALLNQIPTNTNIKALMAVLIPQLFQLLVLTPNADALAGGGPSGYGPTVVSANWFNSTADIFIDIQRPSNMSQAEFWTQAYTIFPALNQYLPCWSRFDWFSSSFSAGGTITIASSTDSEVTGNGTQWDVPTNSETSSYAIEIGSIIEAFDDDGFFHRMQVLTRNSNTSLTLTGPVGAVFTNQPYFIEGFFCDCDPDYFPYPPNPCWNADNAGIDNPPTNYLS
jgi:hypothetical protein